MKNINDPGFFSDDNLNQRAQIAHPRDYGPGPNESFDRAVGLSYSLRRAQAQGVAPMAYIPVEDEPSIVPVQPHVDRTAPPKPSESDGYGVVPEQPSMTAPAKQPVFDEPAAAGAPDMVDALADAVLQRVMQKLNQGGA